MNALVTIKQTKANFDKKLAIAITNKIGSMNTAYFFTILSLISLPTVLTQVVPSIKHFFPSWLLSVSLVALVAWIAQTFLQLVLLPIIMVGQNIQSETNRELHTKVDKIHTHLEIK